MKWPTSPSGAPLPQWIQQRLTTLANQKKLSGIPPEILAAICWFTSDCGITGVGINNTGFGGYFGQHETWKYPTGYTFTRDELLTPSPGQFAREAIVAGSTLASYGLPLPEALLRYSGQSSAFVTYVLSSTYSPTTVEVDPQLITTLVVDNQLHVFLTTKTGKTIKHYWKAQVGTTTKWHSEIVS